MKIVECQEATYNRKNLLDLIKKAAPRPSFSAPDSGSSEVRTEGYRPDRLAGEPMPEV